MNFGRMSPTQRYALVVGVVVIVVIVFLIVNGTFNLGGDDGAADPLALDPGAGEAVEAAAGAAGDPLRAAVGAGAPLAMGQPFQFGDLRLAVSDIRLGDRVGQENDEVQALARFATVRLSARNTGRTPFDLAGRLSLVDGQGRAYAPNAAGSAAAARADADRGDSLTVALPPGITADLIVVFDIAAGAEDLRLRVGGGFVEVALGR